MLSLEKTGHSFFFFYDIQCIVNYSPLKLIDSCILFSRKSQFSCIQFETI